MGWTGFCVTDDHKGCPDTARDEGACDCPCHIRAVQPGHTEHTDDCMSEWGERGRHVMTPQTIACNHRLHLADHYDFVCSLADCGWASDDSTSACPDHGFRVPTDREG